MKKNLSSLLFLFFLLSSASAQSVSFYRENLVMKLDATHMTVTGEYDFRNNYGNEANQTMFFPLPLAVGDLKLDSVSVFDEGSQSYIRHFRKLPAGLFFQLAFQGQEQKKLRIFYVIDHNGQNFTYPVSTQIRYWKKPLAQGNYVLIVEDPAVIIDSTSFKPDEVIADNQRSRNSWKKVNFNPGKELEIWFHHK